MFFNVSAISCVWVFKWFQRFICTFLKTTDLFYYFLILFLLRLLFSINNKLGHLQMAFQININLMRLLNVPGSQDSIMGSHQSIFHHHERKLNADGNSTHGQSGAVNIWAAVFFPSLLYLRAPWNTFYPEPWPVSWMLLLTFRTRHLSKGL